MFFSTLKTSVFAFLILIGVASVTQACPWCHSYGHGHGSAAGGTANRTQKTGGRSSGVDQPDPPSETSSTEIIGKKILEAAGLGRADRATKIDDFIRVNRIDRVQLAIALGGWHDAYLRADQAGMIAAKKRIHELLFPDPPVVGSANLLNSLFQTVEHAAEIATPSDPHLSAVRAMYADSDWSARWEARMAQYDLELRGLRSKSLVGDIADDSTDRR